MDSLRKGFAAPALIGIVVLVLALGVGTYAVQRSGKGKVGMMGNDKGKPVMFSLSEQNNSAEEGKVSLIGMGNQTKVILNVTGAPSEVAQPAHIHLGSCTEIGAVKYPLTSVEKGASLTMIDVSLDDLLKELPLAVNVHKSGEELSVYVACGDVPADRVGNMMNASGSMMKDKDGMMNASGSMKDKGHMMDGGGSMKGGKQVIEITSKGFSPESVEIKKGDMVEFVNRDKVGHWPASAMHPSHKVYPGSDITRCGTKAEMGMFDACRDIPEGAAWSFTFNEVGTWNYHDHSNAGMYGKIIVK